MIEFDIKNLIATLELLHAAKLVAQEQFPQQRDDFENFVKNLMVRTLELSGQARRLELVQTRGLCGRFTYELLGILWSFPEVWNDINIKDPADILTPEIAIREIDGIENVIHDELQEKLFTFVPSAKALYFERVDLFGKDFHQSASAEINCEIKAAGNCLAADLNTAAVFHLIRAAEFGLREFVTHIGADQHLSQSLEESDWSQLIDAADDRVGELIAELAAPATTTALAPAVPAPVGVAAPAVPAPVVLIAAVALVAAEEARQKKAIKDYRTALNEFRILKDEWRNNVMHTRGAYTEHGAMDVYCRVRDFLPRLQRYLKVN